MAGATAGLETNDLSEFDGSNIEGALVLAASTDRANTGTHSLKLLFDGISNDACVYWGEDAITDLYGRVYIYVDTFNEAQYNSLAFVQVWASDWATTLVRVRFQRLSAGSGAPTHWSLDGVGIPAGQDFADANIVGNWHRIEWHWVKGTGANGGVELRVNGATLYSDFTDDLTAYTAAFTRIGNPVGFFTPAANTLIYYDDMGWSDVDWLGEAVAGGGQALAGAVDGVSATSTGLLPYITHILINNTVVAQSSVSITFPYIYHYLVNNVVVAISNVSIILPYIYHYLINNVVASISSISSILPYIYHYLVNNTVTVISSLYGNLSVITTQVYQMLAGTVDAISSIPTILPYIYRTLVNNVVSGISDLVGNLSIISGALRKLRIYMKIGGGRF